MKASEFGRRLFHIPRMIGSRARRLFFSARMWVLFILLVIAAVVTYYVLANRDTPFTTDAYVQAFVIQVAPRIEGQVVGVYVQENQLVRKGDLLFEIDPRPFQYKVNLLQAKLVQATYQVAQMESELAIVKADEERLIAEEVFARTVHEQEQEIYKQDATTNRRYIDAVQKYKTAQAAQKRGQAQIRKAQDALAAKIGEEHALVAEVRAQLADAKLNLEWTRVYSQVNGYVTNVQLREGFYVHIGTPALTCIDSDQIWIVGNFRENSLERIRAGQRVGITFNNYPGRIFPGTVETVGWGVNQGQGSPSGALPAINEPANWIRLAQRFQVRITPHMPDASYPLRVGTTCSIAIYTRDDYWLNDVTELWQDVLARFDYLR